MLTAEREAWTHENGVVLLRTANNCFAVVVPEQRTNRLLRVEVDHQGRRFKEDYFDALMPYRDGLDVDLCECMIRVYEGTTLLAELGSQPGYYFEPWMVLQDEQSYITESYVSVPPALHLTDAKGDRWTLAITGPTDDKARDQAPRGEFAFVVMRNGVSMYEYASRLERRNGGIRIFTRHGWKKLSLSGREFL
jgi:hypothetical protein